MKDVLLKKITIENFKGIRHFDLELEAMVTDVHGNNGAGKTSLYDAYLWLLTGKDSKGSESFKVQPVDERNETIPKLTTSVECCFLINGQDVCLKRSLSQKWSKPKGTDKEILKGNSTDYFVDGVPMTATSYSAKIKELFCDVDKIRMISSVFQFFSLPVKDARMMLIQMAGEMPDLLTEERFPLLYKEVQTTKSVEGAKQKVLFAKKKDEELRVGIPLRIDENERLKPNHDFGALKREQDSIERRIAEIDGVLQRHADATLFDACSELRTKLSQINSLMEDCERSFRKEKADAESKYSTAIDEVNRKIFNLNADVSSVQRKKDCLESEIAEYETSLNECRAEWKKVNTLEFNDETESVCPTCGRAFDESEISERRNESIKRFNVSKVEKLSEIGQKGNKFAVAKKNAEDELASIIVSLDELNVKLVNLKEQLPILKEKLDTVPTIEILKEKSDEYQKLLSKQISLNEQISFESSKSKSDDSDAEIEYEKLRLQARLKDVVTLLADEARVKEIEKRRKELEDEAVDVAARLAEHDALLHEIHVYGKQRINAVEEKVSSMFKLVKFQMYERNITNDGEKEICEPLVDGVPYSGNLNYAKKVNAGIDVVNAISQWLGISMPLFIDNKESVFNTIGSYSQLITLTADRDCEKLVVK